MPIRAEVTVASSLTQFHHHLTHVLPFEKTDESAHRLVDSFHHRFLVLQLAGFEIAAHLSLCSSRANAVGRNDGTMSRPERSVGLHSGLVSDQTSGLILAKLKPA